MALDTFGIVIVDITNNHLDELFFASKAFTIIPFAFKDTPETLHGAVINTMSHA